MKRTLTTTIITLSLLLGLALWSVGRGAHAKTAASPVVAATYPLNPRQFTSLGASPFTTDGTYLINTSKDNPAPTLSGPGIVTPIAGVFFSPSGGTVARDEIAVFTFSSLTIPAGVTVQGVQNANSRPVALLSHSTVTMDGTINVGGADGLNRFSEGKGGDAGPGGGGGGGGFGHGVLNGGLGFVNGGGTYNGGTYSGNGGSVVAGGGGTFEAVSGVIGGAGGAFGGNGGNGSGVSDNPFRTLGGTAYGDLSLTLQGGSGGSGGLDTHLDDVRGGGGGGGGGAVEIGATGAITLAGNVLANGGAGNRAGNSAGCGGGAGGGIVLHAPTVSLSGNLNALGGNAGVQRGGGGGGGRVLILTTDGTLASGSLDANVNVNGGTGNSNGGTGVKQLGIGMFNQAPVAQSQNVTVSAGAACTANASIDNGSYDPDSGNTITLTQAPAGPYPLGTTSVTLTVTDSNGASSSSTATVTVVDNTRPVINAPANLTLSTGAGATSCGLVVSDATLGAATATDNCSGNPAVTRMNVPPGNLFPVGTTTLIYTATDAAGNSQTATQIVTVSDNTPPVISCPANVVVYLPLNSTATSMPVNYPAPTATDNCTASPVITTSQASGSIFPVGATTVNVTAKDAANNQATCSFTVTVRYNFTGFFQPVDNLPVVNVVNAGQAIPVKFSLSGNKGLNIFAAGYPVSQAIACNFTGGTSDVEETVTAGASSLSYDATTDRYSYVWKTDRAWKGTCRQLVVKLNDGPTHVANFQFK